ncbi:MAG: hypothetical protein AAGH41_08040 [Pseudomonadota bacterium]
MKRSSISKLSVALAALAIAGCQTFDMGGGDDEIIFIPPKPDPSPQQLCQVTALAEERKSAIRTVEGADVEGWEKGETFLASKLEKYEARMEIAYRSMVSSCNLYANCLDRNGGNESNCLRSEAGFTKARSQFFNMVSEADKLAAEIEVARQKALAAQANALAAKRRAEQEKKKHQKKSSGDEGGCSPDCATTGNIFTDNCCPVDDDD